MNKFYKKKNNLETTSSLGARGMFHVEDPKILGTTVQNSVARTLYTPDT